MADSRVPDVLTSSSQAVSAWLREIQELSDSDDPKLAFHALRATLHALRDRIPLENSAKFAAQLPTLLRGVYFENWQPGRTPKEVRNREDFLEMVRDEYAYPKDADLEYMTTAVFETINHQVTPDLVRKTRHLLNAELQELWPEPTHAFEATPGEQQAPPPANPLEE